MSTIKRVDDNEYDVTMPDGQRDCAMYLHVNGPEVTMRPVVKRGLIRPSWFHVKVGPKSLVKIRAMSVGETIEL